ncbi:hypothetical protein [Spirillospora sp. NPDC048819]|uniref:hypothetical protein n=1 Tax=Spirillospora sp. NPDC048819 TaxID=3155268 RepID=UPI00340D22A4
MTYQLSALRFRSIGERSARFTDLTLDLTAPTEDGSAPNDSIVWLRNGGGKSSILSLLYAMLLPGANDFMGRAVQRSLTDYIDSGDTSHVIAVWQPREGSRTLLGDAEDVLITGAVHEWADLRRPVQAAKARERLNSTFYACHAVPDVIGLGTLPFTDGGGRTRRLTGYLDELEKLAEPYSRQAALAVTDKHYQWAKVLTDRHLDPEIFRTQKQMNHVEGGVEDLFKFSSAKEFVDFLLDLTTQPDAVNRIAQRLESVAAVLTSKPKKLLERDFCTAAAGALDRVAERHGRLGEAATRLDECRSEAGRLASAFAGTVAEAKAKAEDLAAEREAAQQILSSANTDKSAANDLAYLYRRQAARLRVGEAEEALKEADDRVVQAAALVRTWELAGDLAGLSDLQGRLDQAEIQAEAEEAELAPLRAEADRHAAALGGRLHTLAEQADEQASTAAASQGTAKIRANEQDGECRQANTDLQQAISDATKAEHELGTMDERLRSGVGKGYLPSVTVDLAGHRDALAQRRNELDRRFETLKEQATVRRERRNRIAVRDAELVREYSEATTALTDAATRHGDLSERLSELTASGRLRDLAEATADEPLDLWGEGAALLRRLDNAVLAADEERVRGRAEQESDRRTIQAQQRDAVLPTSLDAERVARLLTAAGIAAESGWSHLRNVLPADRLVAALDVPHIARLGCGVIVQTASMEDAVRLLDSQSAVTTSLVGLYSTADADRLTRAADGTAAVAAGPAWSRLEPGLVDPAHAEAAVRLLKERAQAFERAYKELCARQEEDGELHRILDRFLRDCPAGRLEALQAEADAHDERLGEIEAEQGRNRDEVGALDDAELLDESLREELGDERDRLVRTIDWIDDLLPVLAERGTWTQRRDDARARGREAEQRRDHHAKAASQARLNAQRHERDAEDAANLAVRYRREATELSLAPADGIDDPTVPLDTLRRRWETAARALENRAAQSVLADRVRDLTDRVTQARGDLAGITPDERRRAEAALASPQGQEPHLRAVALGQARHDKDAAVGDHGAARGRLDDYKNRLEEVDKRHRQPPRRALPSVPATAVEADVLALEQETQGQEAQERVTQAESVIGGIEAEIGRAENRSDHFTILLESLPAPAGGPQAPFTAETEAGRLAAREMKDALIEASDACAKREKELNSAVDALRQTTTQFTGVAGPVKDRAAHDPAEVIGPHAADLARRLRLRAQTLTDEIDAIAADQTIIAEALAHLVKDGFDMLGKAERASRMPTSHGSWAGKKVLRIAFDRPGDADLVAYAERVIDQYLGKGLRPEGMPLLKTALHESAGPRGFTVKVLKPATDQVSTTEDISRLAKWSGGEKLTVCVALYCTLAALRAGGRRGRSGGVLLLDNPIGRASSAPLVRLQRDVAAAHGVQLVYTTGVKDPAAVIQFPNVIRLENREGRTRSRRYIVREETDGGVDGVRVAHTDHPWDG